jgi:hypothetical protein
MTAAGKMTVRDDGRNCGCLLSSRHTLSCSYLVRRAVMTAFWNKAVNFRRIGRARRRSDEIYFLREARCRSFPFRTERAVIFIGRRTCHFLMRGRHGSRRPGMADMPDARRRGQRAVIMWQ